MRWLWWRLFLPWSQRSCDNESWEMKIRHRCRVNNVLTLYTCGRPHTASQPMNSRSFVVPVTPCPLSHHHQTTIELLLHRDSRHRHDPSRRRLEGDSPHPTTLLKSTKFLFQCTQLFSALLIELGIPIVSVRKLHKHSLFSSTSSLVRSSSRAWFWMRSWLQSLDSYKKSSPPVTKSKNSLQTRSSHLHLVCFSLMMAMRRNNCTRLRRQYRAFNLHQLPQLISRRPWETTCPPFRVIDDLGSHASQTHAAWLPYNLWFSCHVYISSWQVRVKYRTDTQRSSPIPSVTSNTTPIIQLWHPKQVLPNGHSSARNHSQLPSSPSPHDHHSQLRHTSLDAVCVQEIGVNCARSSSVRLRQYRAQRKHVLFCTLDLDDTITKFHSYVAETLLIFAVLVIRVSFPNRFLRHCLILNCPDKLSLFQTRKLLIHAIHHGIVQNLDNCLVTDSLDQLFVVMGNVQLLSTRMQCHQPMIPPLRGPKITHPTFSASALLLSAPFWPKWYQPVSWMKLASRSWSPFQWAPPLRSPPCAPYIAFSSWNTSILNATMTLSLCPSLVALSSSFKYSAWWYAFGSIASAFHAALMNTYNRAAFLGPCGNTCPGLQWSGDVWKNEQKTRRHKCFFLEFFSVLVLSFLFWVFYQASFFLLHTEGVFSFELSSKLKTKNLKETMSIPKACFFKTFYTFQTFELVS